MNFNYFKMLDFEVFALWLSLYIVVVFLLWCSPAMLRLLQAFQTHEATAAILQAAAGVDAAAEKVSGPCLLLLLSWLTVVGFTSCGLTNQS